MKKTSILLTATFFVLAACKKEKEENPTPPPSPAVGFWTGSYTTTGQLGNEKWAMLLNADGTGRVYEMDNHTDTASLPAPAKVPLVWTLTGNTVQTTFKTGSKTANTTATLNAAANQMSGTWSFDATVKGAFSLVKQ